MAVKYGLREWREHLRDDVNAPVVLCFGDSWFWYPLPTIGNLTTRFLDFGRLQAIDLIAIGDNGMEIGFPSKRILSDLTTIMQWEAGTLDMIVVSGGGNDFAGAEDLDPILKKGGATPASWLKQAELKALFDNIEKGYERVVYLRDTFCPGIPIVTHCYDYAHATGDGLLWISPWLKPSFDVVDMPQAMRPRVLKLIIDRLAAIQKKLSGPKYHFVDTRNLLDATHWSNELHPTGDGFNAIARPFFQHFKNYFPDWTAKPRWF